MIYSTVRQLCGLSILFGAALSVAPEGSVKRIMNMVCSAVLVFVLLQPVADMNISEYALDLARTKALEEEFSAVGENAERSLNRLVIQEEYQTYIKDKAEQLGLEVNPLITLQWSSEGFWLPYEAEMDCAENAVLSDIIFADLGVPRERQKWKE